LERLRQTTAPLSGETLSSKLGVSRVALWKRVKALKAWGYDIRATRKGYELARDDGIALSDLMGAPLIRVFAEITSTMDEARKAAFGDAPSGTMILALRQSAGRGRGGRGWESPQGGLYLSLVLRSLLPPPCAGALVLETAKVLLELLESAGAKNTRFRWPNDIMAGSKKLGGILLEEYGPLDRADFYVLGIGLNFAPLSVSGREAGALWELAAAAPRRRELARAAGERLRAWSESPTLEARRWDRLLDAQAKPVRATLWNGRVLRVIPKGFSPRGELLTTKGELPLSIGECRKMTYQGEES